MDEMSGGFCLECRARSGIVAREPRRPGCTERMSAPKTKVTTNEAGFVRGLGLLDATMIVAGSMIGSGIFIVSADIAREVGSAGWLLTVWLITGVLTISAALSY